MIRKTMLFGILIFSFLISGCASRRVAFFHDYSHGSFQVSYPKNWFVLGNDKGKEFLAISSSPLEKYAHGGFPPRGTMEITIFHFGESDIPRNNDLSYFEPYTLDNEILYFAKTVYSQDHFVIVFQIWDSKLDKEKVEFLEKILKSFRPAAK
ncbi:MAG: hypothetical protein Q8R34_00130 [bacterium]|nr:hypothetical protein [bacterium]